MPVEKEKPPQSESILGQEFVETVLQVARVNLERDGALHPVLFLRLRSDERMVMLLKELPNTAGERQEYFTALGLALRHTGRRIDEAVFMSESWYVEMEEGGAEIDVAPSQHPQRREAITVIGRDDRRTRLTHVLQPFHRGDQNQPIFDERPMEEYNIPAGKFPQAVGLVDYLFDGDGDRGNGASG